MASVLQPEDTAALIQAVHQARGGAGQAINAGVQGAQEGFKQRMQAAGLISRDTFSAAQAGDDLPAGGDLNPEAANALASAGFKKVRANFYLTDEQRKAAADAEKARHQGVTEDQGQQGLDLKSQGLDAKTAYDQGRLEAADRAAAAKTQPGLTKQNQSRAELAQSLLPHMDDFEQTLQAAEQQGLVGPAAGRVYSNFLAGKVGSTGDPAKDELLGHLKTEGTFLGSGMNIMHYGGRGGQASLEKFLNMTDTSKLSSALLKGDLMSMREFAKGYRDMQPVGAHAAPAIPAQAPAASIPGPAAVPQAAQPHPQDATALQWAQQNPNDPRAAKILQLNGAK